MISFAISKLHLHKIAVRILVSLLFIGCYLFGKYINVMQEINSTYCIGFFSNPICNNYQVIPISKCIYCFFSVVRLTIYTLRSLLNYFGLRHITHFYASRLFDIGVRHKYICSKINSPSRIKLIVI